jgi:hypothetical protein
VTYVCGAFFLSSKSAVRLLIPFSGCGRPTASQSFQVVALSGTLSRSRLSVILCSMASHPAVPTKFTCQVQKDNGEWCKRAVAPGEAKCWQHARSWKHRWKSLTRNQTILFVFTTLALVIALVALVIEVPNAWFTYDSWRITRQQTPNAKPTPPRTTGPANTQGDESPANTGDKNTFVYGSTSQKDEKQREQK